MFEQLTTVFFQRFWTRRAKKMLVIASLRCSYGLTPRARRLAQESFPALPCRAWLDIVPVSVDSTALRR